MKNHLSVDEFIEKLEELENDLQKERELHLQANSTLQERTEKLNETSLKLSLDGTKTILLLDDEDFVLDPFCQMLKKVEGKANRILNKGACVFFQKLFFFEDLSNKITEILTGHNRMVYQ